MRKTRLLGALVAASSVAMVVPAVAQAHHATAIIECAPGLTGASELKVTVVSFTPVNGQREAITPTFTNGVSETFLPPFDNGTFVESAPSVPNGTYLGATLKWAEGTYTVPPVKLSCAPPSPSPIPPPIPPPSPPLIPPVVPPAPPAPPVLPPVTPVLPPVVPPAPPLPHHHRHPVVVVLHESYFNQDPPLVAMASQAAPYGCRIVGPPSTQQHGLAHWQVRCRRAKVLPGWRWYVDNRLVQREQWSNTTNGGRELNSWLFDPRVWRRPLVYGRYGMAAAGRVLPYR